MVNQTPLPFSAAQNQTLALLGYQRWLPRQTVATLKTSLAQPKKPVAPPPKSKPIVAPPPPAPEIAIPAAPIPADELQHEYDDAQTPRFVTIDQTGALLAIAHDFHYVSSPQLPCTWLFPPMWAHEDRLSCFSSAAERELWLAAWRAVQLDAVAEVFAALFQRNIPILTVPKVPITTAFARAKKPIVACGVAEDVALPAHLERHFVIHPFLLLQQPLQKKAFWQQLLTLKEHLF